MVFDSPSLSCGIKCFIEFSACWQGKEKQFHAQSVSQIVMDIFSITFLHPKITSLGLFSHGSILPTKNV
jgi:hypothetical protein